MKFSKFVFLKLILFFMFFSFGTTYFKYIAFAGDKVENLMRQAQTVNTQSTNVHENNKFDELFEKYIFSNKEMSKLEQIFWTLVDAVFPTVMVIISSITLAALGISGLGIVIAVAMVVAFVSKALVVYLHTKREDYFAGKTTDNKVLIRDMLVGGVQEALFAPLTVVGGFLTLNVASNLSMKVIAKTALKIGAINFLGSQIAVSASGLVKNIYNEKVLHLDKKLEKLESEKKILLEKLNKGTITDKELEKLKILEKQIYDIKNKEYYTVEQFANDTADNFISSIVIGSFGAVAGHGMVKLSEKLASKPLQKVSVKLFGTAQKAHLLSNVIAQTSLGAVAGAVKAKTYNYFVADKKIRYLEEKRKEALEKKDKKKAEYYEFLLKQAEEEKKEVLEEMLDFGVEGLSETITDTVSEAFEHFMDEREAKKKLVENLMQKDGVDITKVDKKLLKDYEKRAEKLIKLKNDLKVATLSGNEDKILEVYEKILEAKGEKTKLNKQLLKEKYIEELNNSLEKKRKEIGKKLEALKVSKDIDRVDVEKLDKKTIKDLKNMKKNVDVIVNPVDLENDLFEYEILKWQRDNFGKKLTADEADKLYKKVQTKVKNIYGKDYIKEVVMADYKTVVGLLKNEADVKDVKEALREIKKNMKETYIKKMRLNGKKKGKIIRKIIDKIKGK